MAAGSSSASVELPSDAQFAVLDLLASDNADIRGVHRWQSEQGRWIELGVALLDQVVAAHALPMYQTEVREALARLDRLGLLDVALLASLNRDESLEAPTTVRATERIVETLSLFGFSQEAAMNAVTVLSETAVGLKEHFHGMIQRYLRRYGEQMLDEVVSLFPITSLDASRVADAFTYWLQNAAEMPLSLIDDNIRRLCDARGVSVEQLLAEADTVGVNFALLDDLAQRWAAAHPPRKDGGDG